MNRRNVLLGLGAFLVGSGKSFSCMWDTDTLADDVYIQGSSLDLVLGQFPHHGDAYYKLRISRLLKQKDWSLVELNDLAVAHVRLKDFAIGEKYLAKAIARSPDHYPTLSNIGVTAKKTGEFEKAARYIKKALSIKPAGHMGLGDWYLKALVWRQRYENANIKNPPTVNFIGKQYLESFDGKYYGSKHLDSPKGIDKSRQALMVKNDQSFADGFLVFADKLRDAGLLHLAFLADTRALVLGHQNPDEVRRRRVEYLKYHTTFPGKYNMPKNTRNGLVDKTWGKGIAKAEALIQKGADWLEEFKVTEAELLSGKKNEREVNFINVEAAMIDKGVRRVRGI